MLTPCFSCRQLLNEPSEPSSSLAVTLPPLPSGGLALSRTQEKEEPTKALQKRGRYNLWCGLSDEWGGGLGQGPKMRNTGQAGPTCRSLLLLAPVERGSRTGGEFPARAHPLSWEGRWWWRRGKAMSTQCLRCSNSSPRARLSFSPRLIKHIGFSGPPHLALGGLEAPPPSGARDMELPLPAFFRRLPCRCRLSHSLIQTAASACS